MIKLTATRQITPYKWVSRRGEASCASLMSSINPPLMLGIAIVPNYESFAPWPDRNGLLGRELAESQFSARLGPYDASAERGSQMKKSIRHGRSPLRS
jgi:hypothetical protein